LSKYVDGGVLKAPDLEVRGEATTLPLAVRLMNTRHQGIKGASFLERTTVAATSTRSLNSRVKSTKQQTEHRSVALRGRAREEESDGSRTGGGSGDVLDGWR
jgi:hypothetical protein